MKKNLLLLLTFLSVLNSKAQTFDWAEQVGSTSYDILFCIYNDNSGNIYTAGYIEGPADLDPGTGVQIGGGNVADIFIQKLDPNKNLIWAKTITGPSNQYVYGLCLDAAGNILLTGGFSGKADFDPGVGTYTLSVSGGGNDIFILKLDPNGNFIWAKKIGSATGANQNGYAITSDASNNVLVTGAFDDTMDFDPSNIGVYNMTSAGQVDIFVLKLNSAGTFQWAKQMGSFYDDYGYSIKTDPAGNVITTGRFILQTDFDPGPAFFSMGNGTPTTDINMFIQKLDPAGNFIWARDYNFISNTGRGLYVNSLGEIFVTGNTSGAPDFDHSSATVYLPNAGANDIFALKLDGSGNFVWANSFGGTGHDFGYAIDLNASGEVFITGAFSNTADFLPGPGTYTLSSKGMYDIFTLKLDPIGNFLWATSNGGSSDDYGYCIKADNNNNIYTGGYFQNTMDMDPGIGITTFTSTGILDAFMIKLKSGPTNVIESALNDKIQIYPNPVNDKLKVNSETVIESMTITDISGKAILHFENINSGAFEINTNSLAQGVYLVKLSGKESVVTRKFVKQ